MLLFSKNYQERLAQTQGLDASRVDALKAWETYINSVIARPKSARPSERDLHEQFFSDVFDKVLGFEKRSSDRSEWTIVSEYKTDVDATRPDGALGFFNGERDEKRVQVVIELKSVNTDLDLRQTRARDIRTPVDQAFSYAHKYDDVRWVIVSNYREIRLYHRNSSKYALHFDLTKITGDETQLKLFFKLFSATNLIAQTGASETTRLYESREEELTAISNAFYRDYKNLRIETVRAIRQTHDLTPDEAISAAQLLIDRILFIAFLEDTGLIPRETIEKAWATTNPFNPVSRWQNFMGLFAAMDKGNETLKIPPYNGGLFQPNALFDSLELPDDLLEPYKKLADYDFASDLRVNILGHVFEQSITDLEHLKASLEAGEDLPPLSHADSRRHDEGAYYTPDEVTAYIVNQTLLPYLAQIREELGEANLPELQEDDIGNRKKAAKARVKAHIAFYESYMDRLKRLRILDPSVGSGAFLVAAFDALVAEGQQVNRELASLGAPLLFTKWDREVLKNNLYGVDISAESIEITRLSMWLKIASNKEPLIALDESFRAGNAVISDPAIDPENAFDWEQAFPHVFADGGFDIVLGNPPYVRHELIREIKPGLTGFETYAGTADLYVYFFELGHRLLKEGGYLGYIASNKWMRAGYGQNLRRFFKENTTITHLLDKGQEDIFEDATAYPALVIFKKQTPPDEAYDVVIADEPFDATRQTMSSEHLRDDAWLLHQPLYFQIRQRMESIGKPLGEWDVEINRGILTGFNEAFIIDDAKRRELIAQDPKSTELIKPVLRGRDIEKWHVGWPGTWLINIENGWTNTQRGETDAEAWLSQNYPALYRHLKHIGDTTKGKGKGLYNRDDQGDYWWELRPCAYCDAFEQEKIIYPEIKNTTAFSLDTRPYYHNNKIFHITGNPDDLHYLVAILNADLIFWYLKNSVALAKGNALELRESYMRHVPIPPISKEARAPFMALAEDLTAAHNEIETTRQTFLALLQDEFSLDKLSNKLQHWHTHDFKTLQGELKKTGITLTGPTKDDYFDRYTRRTADINALQTRAQALQSTLNTEVNKLYGLNADEITFIADEEKN